MSVIRSGPVGTESSREPAETAAAIWIARRGSPGWDAAAFEAWLDQSVSHRAAYYRLNAAWMEAGRLKVLRSEALARAEVAVDPREDDPASEVPTPFHSASAITKPGKAATRGWHHAAAIAAVIAVATFGVWVFRTVSHARTGLYTTPVGGMEYVPLSDGSRITLNTDSEVRVSLIVHERRVSLDRGEAYFEVAKDRSRPFVVRAGGTRVVAVGTAFSVRRDGDDIQVVVNEGTVRLEAQYPFASGGLNAAMRPADVGTRSTHALLLPAGSVARAQSEAVLVKSEAPAEIEQALSWRSGQLTFRDTPLAQAVAEFNRYNARKLVVQDDSIAELRLGGVFRSTDIDPFVALLERGFPVRAGREGDRILLTHN